MGSPRIMILKKSAWSCRKIDEGLKNNAYQDIKKMGIKAVGEVIKNSGNNTNAD